MGDNGNYSDPSLLKTSSVRTKIEIHVYSHLVAKCSIYCMFVLETPFKII